MPQTFPQGISLPNSYIDLTRSNGLTLDKAPAGATRLAQTPQGFQVSEDGGLWSPLLGSSPNRIRVFDQFASSFFIREVCVPLFSSADGTNRVTVNNGDVISCMYRPSRGSVLNAVAFMTQTTLAAGSDANYITFGGTNKVGDGLGTINLFTGGNAATTKVTGGSAWTAFVSRTVAVTAAPLDLALTTGDVLHFTITVTGTLGAVLINPTIRILIVEIDPIWFPGQFRTTSIKGPVIQPVANGLNGLTEMQLNDGSGSNQAYLGWNQVMIDATKRPIFRTKFKFTGAAANQHMVWGLGSSGNTPDAMTYNAWFRQEGTSLAALYETDDNSGGGDRDDQAYGVNFVEDTWYIGEVDMSTLSATRFTLYSETGAVLGTPVTSNASAIPAGATLQPFVSARKESGTSTGKITLEWVDVSWGV